MNTVEFWLYLQYHKCVMKLEDAVFSRQFEIVKYLMAELDAIVSAIAYNNSLKEAKHAN